MTEPLVELADVHRSYVREGEVVPALRGVSFEVRPAEFAVVTGPAGSGKSTLLQVMAGLDRPTEGQIFLEGRPLADMPDDDLTLYRRRRVGFIFEHVHLLPSLSAVDNVALPLLLDGGAPDAARKIATERLERLGLADRADRRPQQMNGGEQQRVAIARALVTEPALLLADEPAGDLDPQSGAEVYRILSEVPRVFGTAIVMVTHDQGARDLGDRTMYLKDGRLTELPARKSA